MNKTVRTVQQTLAFAGIIGLATSVAFAESDRGRRQCVRVGGAVLTNFAVVDENTTLGIATGDLKGAVAATILGISPNPDGTSVFSVQHHWVTEQGDTIYVGRANATVAPVPGAPGLVAIVNYPVSITGGTGRFEGATGALTNIGEADLNTGQTVFRYTGEVCFAATAQR